jgi:SHS2 domain-containing protein
MQKFKFLEHTADIKFQAFGKNVEEVFENSALAFKEAVCGKMKIKEEKEKIIKVSGRDFESLMYLFLEKILYLLEAENLLISNIKEIEIKNFKLKAKIVGDSAKNYKFTDSVKAVTYNEMFIKKQKDKWISQVVLDV